MKVVTKDKQTPRKRRSSVSEKKHTGVSKLWRKIKARMTSEEIDQQLRKLREEWW